MLACLLGGSIEFANRYSPDIEQISEKEILIYLSAAWEAELRCIKEELPKGAQLGAGSTRSVARLAARKGEIVVPGGEAAFLGPLPIELLPLEEETRRRLHLLGLATLGEVAKLSKSDLYLQFGAEGIRLFDWVQGRANEPLQKQRASEPIEASCDLEQTDQLDSALLDLLEQLFAAKAFVCREMALTLVLDGADPLVVPVRFSRPPRDPKSALRVAASRLEQISLPAPLSALHLEVTDWREPSHSQLDFLEKRAFEELLGAISPKTKPTLLMKLVWDDAACRLPERRLHLQSLVREGVTRALYQPKPCDVAADSHLQPEAVQEIPVSSLRQSWDIQEEWWSQQPIARTYYDAALKNGRRQCLFYDHRAELWYTQ